MSILTGVCFCFGSFCLILNSHTHKEQKQITAKQGTLQQAATGKMGYEKERAREVKSENCQKSVVKSEKSNLKTSLKLKAIL